MLQKNLPLANAFVVIFIRLWLDLLALIHFIIQGKGKDAWAVSRAHQDFFINFIRNSKKRKKYSVIENKNGIYQKSIIWDFYVNKIQKFTDLSANSF